MKMSNTFLHFISEIFPKNRFPDQNTHSQLQVIAALILNRYVGAFPIFLSGVNRHVVILLKIPALGSEVDLLPPLL